MNQNDDTEAFLNVRREKLGGELIYRSYATWYGRSDGDKREFGVFIYSDGRTLVLEDFERTPTILGIRYTPKKKSEYRKLEIFIPADSITGIDRITRRSAELSVMDGKDRGKVINLFAKLFKKTVTRVALEDGTAYYLEIADTDKLKKTLNK